MPQYGGFCAWGIAAKHELFPADPTAWQIIDGKLYLTFNKAVRDTWGKNQADYIKRADRAWVSFANTSD